MYMSVLHVTEVSLCLIQILEFLPDDYRCYIGKRVRFLTADGCSLSYTKTTQTPKPLVQGHTPQGNVPREEVHFKRWQTFCTQTCSRDILASKRVITFNKSLHLLLRLFSDPNHTNLKHDSVKKILIHTHTRTQFQHYPSSLGRDHYKK